MKVPSLLFCCLLFGSSVLAKSRVRRIIGGEPAQLPPSPSSDVRYTPPEPDEDGDTVVFVKKDRRSADIVGTKNIGQMYSFLGIRYAEAPVGRFRFVRTRRLKPKGLVDARRFGPPCPQWYKGQIVGMEDCLILNVYTPEIPATNSSKKVSLPVVIFVHGGNFKTGSASQYIPTHLVKRGVIVVTVQYRLGKLGFLSMRRKDLPGNAGLFDIALAVHWVNDYIRFFGGNPHEISYAGQGSGASCVSHLVMNRLLRSNPRKMIALSGTPVSPFATDPPIDVRSANEVRGSRANDEECKEKDVVSYVRCMQDVPLEALMKQDLNSEERRRNQSTISNKLSNLFTPGPIEEGKDDFRGLPNFILEAPLEAISHGHFPKIPLLTGVTKQETGAGIKGNLLKEITEKLLKSLNFLEDGLFKELLQANTGLYINNTVNPSLSQLFNQDEYLKFFTGLVDAAVSNIDKMIEHTTDALFNLPAFIFSNFWSKQNNVFLYSFEHTPMKSRAKDFLNDIALVSNNSSEDSKGPSHGDDLIYLFDVRSLEGEPILNSDTDLNEADLKVRDHFSSSVAEFVRSGTPKTEGGEPWVPFNDKDLNYMIIQEKPKSAKGFKKCSMALWTGDSNLMNSIECNLKGATKIVTDTLGSAGTGLLKSAGSIGTSLNKGADGVKQTVKGGIGTLTQPIKPLANIGKLGQGNKKPQKTSPGGLLGGLIG